MLGYDLQISTVTQTVMAGNVNMVMYIWLYKIYKITFPMYNQSLSNSVGSVTAPKAERSRFGFSMV
jgi:hypothetical protein